MTEVLPTDANRFVPANCLRGGLGVALVWNLSWRLSRLYSSCWVSFTGIIPPVLNFGLLIEKFSMECKLLVWKEIKTHSPDASCIFILDDFGLTLVLHPLSLSTVSNWIVEIRSSGQDDISYVGNGISFQSVDCKAPASKAVSILSFNSSSTILRFVGRQFWKQLCTYSLSNRMIKKLGAHCLKYCQWFWFYFSCGENCFSSMPPIPFVSAPIRARFAFFPPTATYDGPVQ
jgi:hypothetical protein